jgi:transposase
MRGEDRRSGGLFSDVDLEARVPADHPLRPIQAIVDDALSALSGEFAALYSHPGRPSIPPERLLRALLLQAFYSVRSERLLMEQLDCNLLFHWFVGLGIDDPVWHPTAFTTNLDQLLEGEVAAKFLAAAPLISSSSPGYSKDKATHSWRRTGARERYPIAARSLIGEADESGIGQREALAGLGSVRLVGNDNDVVPLAVRLVGVHILVEFVDDAEDAPIVLFQQLFKLLARGRARRPGIGNATTDERLVDWVSRSPSELRKLGRRYRAKCRASRRRSGRAGRGRGRARSPPCAGSAHRRLCDPGRES